MMVIIGAGECGMRAAAALREQGCTGPVTVIGGEDDLPYERPPLSKAVLDGSDPVALPADGIDVLRGVAATALDRDARGVVLADGRRVPYTKLLLATGAAARRLPIPGAEHALTLRSLADARTLAARLAPGTRVGVVGGGFLGLEIAAAAAGRGCAVTVVEAAPAVLGRVVPAGVAAVVARRHEAAGVVLRCGTGVAHVGPDGLTLTSGEVLTCDVVVAAVGAVPETELAEKAGLAIEDGVRVDEHLTTSDPDVLAAGDCCSVPLGGRRVRLESWRAARDQGEAAARAMLGRPEPYTAVPWFWSDQYELTLQVAGLPPLAATRVVRSRSDGVAIEFGLAEDGRLVSASAVGVGGAVAKDVKLALLLIQRGVAPDPAALADPGAGMKALLRAS